MAFVTVPILYDNARNFFPNGKWLTIDTQSEYLGTIKLPSAAFIPSVPGYVPEATLLRIKTKEFDEIYVNLTLAAYNALIQEAEVSPSADYTYTTTISGTPNYVTDTPLFNIAPLTYTVNGVGYDVRTVTYTSNSNGTGTVTFPSNFTAGDVVQITYRNN